MNSVRAANPAFADVVPYDPKYLPADAMLSANESPYELDTEVQASVLQALEGAIANRYPDPLANDLRDAIAQSYSLARENVLVGNGGDELIFDIALAWGGQHRTMLNVPPTFSSYTSFSRLFGTQVVDIPRNEGDFSIDEEAVLARVAQGDIDWIALCSPNNPTGDLARLEFIEQLLNETDALVLIDEAYGEFCEQSTLSLFAQHKNLVILHTFSKAYRLAGVRVGYILAHPEVISELCKVRMPYSVGVFQQAAALAVWNHRASFEESTRLLVSQRQRLEQRLSALDGVQVFSSQANYVLVRIPHAGQVWQQLFERGILVRDFSAGELTRDCLRISVGTPEQNDAVIEALQSILAAFDDGFDAASDTAAAADDGTADDGLAAADDRLDTSN